MSDFTASGWSLFVGAVTLASLAACLVLLFVAARRKVVTRPDGSVDDTTGHVWDEDLRELNNPLPRWWMWLFVVTVAFSLAYLWLYPGLGSQPGTLEWSSTGQYRAERARATEAAAPLFARLAGMSHEQLAADPQALGLGERLFVNHCATCHGSDARGSRGFPNLTDGDWLWGGSFERIRESIAEGRQGAMPPMAAVVGSSTELRHLAHHVLSLSGSAHDSLAAQLGRAAWAPCAACHGAAGKGNPALGAPNLTDRIWLHGWGEQAIVDIVTHGRTGTMPAHAGRLSKEQIDVLAAYVWQLSRPLAPSVQPAAQAAVHPAMQGANGASSAKAAP